MDRQRGYDSGNGVNAAGLFNPAAAGAGNHLITYTYTNGNGCTAVATRSIIVNSLPVVNAGVYTAVCINAGTVILNGSPAGGSFSGSGISGNIFNPAVAEQVRIPSPIHSPTAVDVLQLLQQP